MLSCLRVTHVSDLADKLFPKYLRAGLFGLGFGLFLFLVINPIVTGESSKELILTHPGFASFLSVTYPLVVVPLSVAFVAATGPASKTQAFTIALCFLAPALIPVPVAQYWMAAQKTFGEQPLSQTILIDLVWGIGDGAVLAFIASAICAVASPFLYRTVSRLLD